MGEEGSEFIRLGELISDESFRGSIQTNFREAAQEQGVNLSQIPDEVLDTLDDLSKEELAILARVKARLEAAGVDKKYRAELV
jgi:hypothetical protein